MGFNLRLRNVPSGAAIWLANFGKESGNYDPYAESGWIAINRPWSYPSDPRNSTSLFIGIIDTSENILVNVYNLGPVRDGWSYIYDCSTGVLIECRLEGSIIEKGILRDTESLAIPAEIALGEQGVILIRGSNDDLVAQQMGVWWKVTFGDLILEEITQWAAELVPPANIIRATGGLLPFNMEGTYKIAVDLMMNKDCPESVDIYLGNLCTVVSAEGIIMEFTVGLLNAYPGTTRWKCWFANEERSISTGGMANLGEGVSFSVEYNRGYIGVELYDAGGKVIYSAETVAIFSPTNSGTYYWDCLTHTIDNVAGEPSLIDPDVASPDAPPEFIAPEEKRFPWTPVLIGGGALIATIGLIAASKR